MQLLQAVLAPEASGEEEKVHLVLSMKDGHKLQQALQLVPPQGKVVLVHIHRPAMMIPIPTMGGTVHASILKDNIVKDYRDEQRDQALQALEGYKEICTRAEASDESRIISFRWLALIQAETLMTENDNVSAGLLELIAEHKITTLIIIGIGKSCRQDGSVFAFETKGTPSSISSRRLSLSCSSNSSPYPVIWDSCSTPSSILWDSRSIPDSLDPSQLDAHSLEIAGSIVGDSRLIVILGESIDTFRELTGYLNLVRDSHEMHQAFQSKYSEIVSRCQFIGSIDSVLEADPENCGDDYWKTITAWPAAFEHIVSVLNKVLQLLKQDSFTYNGLTPDKIFTAAQELIDRFLKVASAVTKVRKSPEKLFCTLYMCKAIVDSTPSLKKVFPSDFLSRIDSVHTVLNDSARGILGQFKELIQNYSSHKVAQDGSILLVTGYVMRYIRMLTNHAGSLDTILDYGQNSDLLLFEGTSLAGHLVCGLVGDLNEVIEQKSRLYACEGLRCLFLMNNANFIIQEIEHSDIKLIVGAEWLKQRRDEFDMHMRGYMSSTWEQVTSCLTAAACPPPKRLKPGLLGIFHTNARPLQNFGSAFKETCNSQMNWKVPCPVLRSKLRDSISEHVTQAYKAYWETLRQSSAGVGRDFKSKVSELFEGSYAFKETCNSQTNWKVRCPVLRSKLCDSISEHVTQAYKAYWETLRQSSAGVVRDFESKVSELFEGFNTRDSRLIQGSVDEQPTLPLHDRCKHCAFVLDMMLALRTHTIVLTKNLRNQQRDQRVEVVRGHSWPAHGN
ncbi:hypothetical protein C2845_PM07G33000 [Panicum miliaceum]|uniref:Exocyst subunit Exo70 family protein n=1 Tax=Panicum miliaceum TaxID=4540 RepID=A0A3L6SKV9_PANMI|nr:hypothetical protein C2845_PM07G33000 [Panicum miliaceum]